mgnify:CR=1 FL=1
MAEENQGGDGQEKTQEPTQRRLEKAAEEGRLLSSKDMFVLTTLSGLLLIMFAVPSVTPYLLGNWGSMFSSIEGVAIGKSPLEPLYSAMNKVLIFTVIIGLPIMVITVITQLIVGGINFAPKSFSFKGNRINPISGIKRIFSIKGLVELGKAIMKVTFLGSIGATVLYNISKGISSLPSRNLDQALMGVSIYFPTLLGSLLVGLALIAIVDYIWQRHSHNKSLKMSHQDLKDEFKQTEGSPEVRARIRKLQMETVQRSAAQAAAIDDVDQASAVFINPSHFAIALKYEVGAEGAPIVLAMGRGKIAEKIIDKAEKAKITIFRSPILTRALYYTSEIGAEISDKLYTAVAIALAYIYKIEKGESLEEPHISVPEDLHFDENGKVLKND